MDAYVTAAPATAVVVGFSSPFSKSVPLYSAIIMFFFYYPHDDSILLLVLGRIIIYAQRESVVDCAAMEESVNRICSRRPC